MEHRWLRMHSGNTCVDVRFMKDPSQGIPNGVVPGNDPAALRAEEGVRSKRVEGMVTSAGAFKVVAGWRLHVRREKRQTQAGTEGGAVLLIGQDAREK